MTARIGMWGASLLAALAVASAVGPGRAWAVGEYGFRPGTVTAGESTRVAGAHPDLSMDFELNSEESGEPVQTTSAIKIALPAGLIGDPNAVAQCSEAELLTTNLDTANGGGSCPTDSQVGITEVFLFNREGRTQSLIEPIFNMEPPEDGTTVARLGFFAKFFPTFINVHVRSDSDYGLTASIEGVGSLIPLLSAKTTIWGVPAAESHDSLRITPYEAVACGGSPCTAPGEQPRKSGLAPAPFLSNATACGGPQEVRFTAVSYAEPSRPVTEVVQMPGLTGCERLGFAPTLDVAPTSHEAATPTGLDVDLHLPQDETPNGRATAQLRGARVELPEGMTIAAGAADGLAACDAEEAGYRSDAPARCPDAAKIGTATIDIPALSRPIEASVYQRTPEPGHLFRIWLVADELGVHLALPGEIELNPVSGQVTSIFVDTPQAPVRDLQLHLKSGSHAPLANPAACGTYATHWEFTPWSGTPPVAGDTPMAVDENCATGGFRPQLTAGTESAAAGAFSPFILRLDRQSGEQNPRGLELTLPTGLLAKLSGVPLCPQAQAASGNCPAASQVGSAKVASGPGPSPLWLPQAGREPISLFLAGPYEGAPYSLVIRAPAQAGPFDLGTVLVRQAISVNPETAQVTVRSDPLPQILEGVPISYRTIYAAIDRPRFTLNPTNCDAKQVQASLTSAGGTQADASTPFQVGSCARLPFKPKLALRVFGSTHRAAKPRFRAVLRMKPGEANIRRAVVNLPHSEFLEQGHLKDICTRAQFNAGGGHGEMCPKRSIYGHARAVTPLLDEPLKGPVYLRSSSHRLPDLVAALNGQIDIELDGKVDSGPNRGLRTTFEVVPDAPVSKFTLEMHGGKKGLLVNSEMLCSPKAKTRGFVRFTGQNGKVESFKPKVRNGCGGHSRKKPHKTN